MPASYDQPGYYSDLHGYFADDQNAPSQDLLCFGCEEGEPCNEPVFMVSEHGLEDEAEQGE
eukprot:3667046-Amphidinium_carterae.1